MIKNASYRSHQCLSLFLAGTAPSFISNFFCLRAGEYDPTLLKADKSPEPLLAPVSVFTDMAFSEFELLDVQMATSSTDDGALKICPDDERPSEERATGAD